MIDALAKYKRLHGHYPIRLEDLPDCAPPKVMEMTQALDLAGPGLPELVRNRDRLAIQTVVQTYLDQVLRAARGPCR